MVTGADAEIDRYEAEVEAGELPAYCMFCKDGHCHSVRSEDCGARVPALRGKDRRQWLPVPGLCSEASLYGMRRSGCRSCRNLLFFVGYIHWQ